MILTTLRRNISSDAKDRLNDYSLLAKTHKYQQVIVKNELLFAITFAPLSII